jgi:hypothetical protein
MDCKIIEKTEEWKNHIEELDPVCATNTSNAKRAARPAGRAKSLLVLNAAKAALVARMTCGKGTCRTGLNCVSPAIRDVQVSNTSLDIEVKLLDPQPDPNPCKGRKKQYSADAIIGFKIKAKCKCARPAPEAPSLFTKGSPKKAQKRKRSK